MAEIFLKLDGIPGESTDAKHPDEIEVAGFSWGVERPGGPGRPGGGAGAGGRPAFRAFSFQMSVNRASPELFLACASGKHLKDAHLSVRKAGKGAPDYLQIRFRDVVITSFEQAAGDDAPMETVAFEFGDIELEYAEQDDRGRPGDVIKAGWDLSKNVKV